MILTPGLRTTAKVLFLKEEKVRWGEVRLSKQPGVRAQVCNPRAGALWPASL